MDDIINGKVIFAHLTETSLIQKSNQFDLFRLVLFMSQVFRFKHLGKETFKNAMRDSKDLDWRL